MTHNGGNVKPMKTEGVEPADCDHAWHFVRDWYGDPNVINGTADCSFYECKRCGLVQQEKPSDMIEEYVREREYE